MIRADAELNAGGFLSTLKSLDEGILKFGAKFAILTKDFEGFTMIAEKVEQVFDRFKESLELGATLNNLSAETGQSVGDLMVLRQAFKNAEVGADAVEPIFQKFNENLSGIGGEAATVSTALGRLGLTAAGLRSKTGIEQMEALQEAFKGVTAQADKARIVQDLFGKGGGHLLSLIGNTEGIEEARSQVGGLGGTMQAMAPLFDKISTAIGSISLKFEQLSTGALSVIAPQLGGAADAFSRLDFTQIGVSIGGIAKAFVDIGGAVAPLAPSFATIVSVVGILSSVIKTAIPVVISLGAGWLVAAALTRIAAVGIVSSMRAVTTATVTGIRAIMVSMGPLGIAIALLSYMWLKWKSDSAQTPKLPDLTNPGLGGAGISAPLQAHVGHLQSIGGGGGFGLSSQNPSLTLQATTNKHLADIKSILERSSKSTRHAAPPPPKRVAV